MDQHPMFAQTQGFFHPFYIYPCVPDVTEYIPNQVPSAFLPPIVFPSANTNYIHSTPFTYDYIHPTPFTYAVGYHGEPSTDDSAVKYEGTRYENQHTAIEPSDDNPSRPPEKELYFTHLSSDDVSDLRSHEYYSLPVHNDGKYYCPVKGCMSFSTRQSGYYKHLDSHLKPYQCHEFPCCKQAFGSPGSLYRHLRQIHGMHGYNDEIFVCQIRECERASPKRGFLQKYGCIKHMKDTHGYNPRELDPLKPSDVARTFR